MVKVSEEEMNRMVKIIENVFEEFLRDGKVTTVRCFKCGGLVEMQALSSSVWRTTCPCGKFNDTLKGL